MQTQQLVVVQHRQVCQCMIAGSDRLLHEMAEVAKC